MAKGREESDDRVVPKGRRKAAPTAEVLRGGKAVTARNEMVQLALFRETADSPKGDDGGVESGRPGSATHAVPKSRTEKGRAPSAMTMEAVAAIGNLRRAFERVAKNDGAPGPDRQSVEAVGEQVRRLQTLGIKRKAAKTIYKGRRSWWSLSHCPAVDMGLHNAYFAERGLVSIAARWQTLHDQRVNAPVQLALTLG